MTIEAVVAFLDDLNALYPEAGTGVKDGDDHIRNLKTALLATFPNLDAAVTPTPAELNLLDGLTELPSGQQTLIRTTTISSDSTIDFTGLDGTYAKHIFILQDVVPSTDNADLRAKISIASTFLATSYDYYTKVEDTNLDNDSETSNAGTYIPMAIKNGVNVGVGSASNEGLSGTIEICSDLAATDQYKQILWNMCWANGSGNMGHGYGAGQYNGGAGAIDGFRIYCNTGNLESGTIYHIGVNK